MITGEYKNSLDEKGRIFIPSKIRSSITGNVLVITKGVDACLWLFPVEEWKKISEKLMDSVNVFHKDARRIQRHFIAPAQEVEIDKSGRIMVSQTLREYANLQKDCYICGMGKRIELWDEGEYKSYFDQNGEDLDAVFERNSEILSF
ncbi:MAG: division/cell wall cluster transcriptional repressor MraZ [Spirochaetales bacterium]|nr:MAG: division/cell wall cluster transcriptional repressor MraZ [Spirochaetales bacterium]